MSIDVQIRGHSARIAVSGRFDFQVHRDFKDAYTPLVDNAAASEIELEMSKVDYMDSSALGMLLLLDERAKAANKSIMLLVTSGFVSRVFEFANFGSIFNIKHI